MTFVELLVDLIDCENIANIFINRSYEWKFTIKCSNCHHTHDKEIYLSETETVQGKNNRSECNFYMKCKECSHDLSINIDTKGSPYEISVDGKDKIKGRSLAKFECRNTQILKWHMEGDIHAKAYESSTIFENIDISDCWCEYDEKTSQSVMIDKVVS